MALLALLIALAPFFAEARLILRQECGSTAQIDAQIKEVILEGEPVEGDLAATSLSRAAEIVQEVRTGVADEKLPDGSQFYFDFWVLQGKGVGLTPEVREATRVRELACLKELTDAGAFLALAEARTAPRTVIWDFATPFEGPGLGQPHLGPYRDLARANLGRMALAASDQEWDTYTDAVSSNLALARILARQGSLIHRLHGPTIQSQVFDQMPSQLAASVPPQVCKDLLGIIDKETLPSIDLTLRFARLETARTAITYFTDGPLGGRPILSKYFADNRQVLGLLSLVGFEAPTPDFSAIPGSDLLGLFLASRAETLAELSLRHDQLDAMALLPRHQRSDTHFGPDLHLRHTFTETLAGYILPAFNRWLATEEDARLRRDAVRIMLALELYRSEHADYPDSLNALVPNHLPSLPHDPIADHPLVYRRLDQSTAPHGRSYILYSRGVDRTDNGGEYDADKNFFALRSALGEGRDFVFNVPPPKK
jgi:hypothetical protein